MKKLALLISLFLVTTVTQAQKVTVTKKSDRIKGESTEGYVTTLEGKNEEIAAAWSKYLKGLGKVKTGSDYSFIETPAMGGTVYTSGVLYAKNSGGAESGSVWLGIRPDEWTVNDIKLVEEAVEKLVYQFGIKFYKDKIQAQINEAQEAMNIVVRQQQRLVNENKTLTGRLTTNEQQKIQLEKALEANKLEHLVLQQKIVNNKKAQDSVAATTIPIRRAIELHQERLRKVN
ncbi:MAG: hypothetical protein JNL40_10990 [Cyclobacteriaceae bacterium]|nr:hypothetical protein [Cyclobacteriaceae bacterium]